jgi:hypothetical protein
MHVLSVKKNISPRVSPNMPDPVQNNGAKRMVFLMTNKFQTGGEEAESRTG